MKVKTRSSCAEHLRLGRIDAKAKFFPACACKKSRLPKGLLVPVEECLFEPAIDGQLLSKLRGSLILSWNSDTSAAIIRDSARYKRSSPVMLTLTEGRWSICVAAVAICSEQSRQMPPG